MNDFCQIYSLQGWQQYLAPSQKSGQKKQKNRFFIFFTGKNNRKQQKQPSVTIIQQSYKLLL